MSINSCKNAGDRLEREKMQGKKMSIGDPK